jgi:hypothetical protein
MRSQRSPRLLGTEPHGNPGTTPQAKPRDRSSSPLGLGRNRGAEGYIDLSASLGSSGRRPQGCRGATSRPHGSGLNRRPRTDGIFVKRSGFLDRNPESPCKRTALPDPFGMLLPLKGTAIDPDCRAFVRRRRVSEGTRTPDRLDHK